MFLVATPVGENLTRLRSLVFPLMLLTAFLARFRPRWLAALALSAALVYNVAPYVAPVLERTRPARRPPRVLGARRRLPAESARARTTASRSSRRSTTGRRTGCRRPASHSPAAGTARSTSRGTSSSTRSRWAPPPTATGCGAWASASSSCPRPVSARRARSARRRCSARAVRACDRPSPTAASTIYELPRPAPILAGPGSPRVTRLDHSRIEGRLTEPGTYSLKIRYTRYWRVRAGAVCVERVAGGMTRLKATRPGRFALAVPERPDSLVRLLVGRPPARC